MSSRRLQRRDNEGLPPLPSRLDFHTLRNWLEATRNDLEDAALSIEPSDRRGQGSA